LCGGDEGRQSASIYFDETSVNKIVNKGQTSDAVAALMTLGATTPSCSPTVPFTTVGEVNIATRCQIARKTSENIDLWLIHGSLNDKIVHGQLTYYDIMCELN